MSFALSRQATDTLRGWAILAVVWIHVLSMLPGLTQLSVTSTFFVVSDQLSRFCVPLFFLLSGWSLQFAYGEKKISWLGFMRKRLKKLLPLYFLWSILSYLVFKIVPQWGMGDNGPSFLQQIIFGQADYQLYFWFVIVQFYAVFPVLSKLFKKFPHGVLIGSWLIQFGMLRVLPQLPTIIDFPYWLGMDRVQYVWGTVWIGYFTLGMWIAKYGLPVKLRVWAWIAAGLGGALAILNARQLLSAHVDPLLAFQFTRPAVYLYGALFGVAACIEAHYQTQKQLNKKQQETAMSSLGKWSYVIFLNHLILLRLIAGVGAGWLDGAHALQVFLVWLIGSGLSVVLVRKDW